MHKPLLFLILLLLCFTASAQRSQKPVSITAVPKPINYDSIAKAEMVKYHRKIDSLNKEQYIALAKETNELASGNNTYYGLLFGGIGVLVTLAAIFLGYNLLAVRAEWQQTLQTQERSSATALENQRTEYNAALESQTKVFSETVQKQSNKFNELETTAKQFQEQFKKAMDDLIDSSQQKLKDISTKGYQDEHSTIKIDDLQKEIDRLKKTVHSVGIPTTFDPNEPAQIKYFNSVDPVSGEPYRIICTNCGFPITYDLPQQQFQGLDNAMQQALGIKKHPVLECPKCHHFNKVPSFR